jgi:hypothetical protein
MVERPEKKPKYVSDWRNRPYGEATPSASKKRAELADALVTYIQKNNDAWVTSLGGKFPLRVEIPQGSTLPSKLMELGYSVRSAGAGTRIGTTTETITAHSTRAPIIRHHSGIFPVDVIEISLGG